MHVPDLIGYLSDLERNNNRAWFAMNKPRYDILRAEFLQLVTALIGTIGKHDPAVLACNPAKALFRINRDTRFAKDKRPYKNTFSAAITASGLKKPSQGGGPAYYFQINAEGRLMVAGGEWMPPPERLRQIRQAIEVDAAGLRKVLAGKRFAQTFGGLQEEGKLARAPKGYDPQHPEIDLIRNKNFIAWTELDLRGEVPEDLQKVIATGFRDVSGLVGWLRAVPPASLAD
ncbi:DUF2461 domain-containing protein [Lacisediminimonas sp.]|uniref:DUF2461 domain-containing protein n=1 Tax=Lacisediminimonas sp. TaxID=3060582 RepID=UPI00271564F3|nr:DUF2461 domain-containing protein [Lacisediminimonas sp.]MDO8298106.1 DUF2461 domain-containing protein [Lacisediminimonas sp.]